MYISEVLSRFKSVKKTSNGYRVQCPCHNDRNPSLDIAEKDGKILLYCHAGCSAEDILRSVDLNMKDLFNVGLEGKIKGNPEIKIRYNNCDGIHGKSIPGKVQCYYEYTDENGVPLYRKVRFEPKNFKIERFENGKWLSGISGVKRVLYNLPEVLKGLLNGETIYIVEGEKDAETLKKYNKIATCSSFGAGKSKWTEKDSEVFKNANVIIIQDNDDIGKEFSENIAISLLDIASSVKLIDISKIWPDMPEHGDVSDFLESHTMDELEKLILGTAPYKAGGFPAVSCEDETKTSGLNGQGAEEANESFELSREEQTKTKTGGLNGQGVEAADESFELSREEQTKTKTGGLNGQGVEEADESFELSREDETKNMFAGSGYSWDGENFQVKIKDGSKYLGNFYLKVTKEIIKDKGTTVDKFYELEPITQGAKLAPRMVSSKNINNLNFLTDFWGLILRPAIMYNIDKLYLDSLRAQYGDIPCMTIYSHTGWKKIDGRWVFLHAGGAIGCDEDDKLENPENIGAKNDIHVELEQKLLQYCLDTPPETEFDLDVICKLFDLSKSDIIYPLIGFIFLTPLNEFLRQKGIEPSFILYLLGETGSKKSTIAALFMSFFGDFNNKGLPSSFKDTANSLEKQGALLKDVVTVIDDFHPTASSKEANLMNATAQRLVRMYGDRTGKARLSSNCDFKTAYIPKGNAMCTGEDLPNIGQSGLGRLFIVELEKNSMDLEILSFLQKNTAQLTNSMREYIKWLAKKVNNSENFSEVLHKEFITLRDSINLENIHGRIIETIAHLQIGINMFCEFIRDFSKEARREIMTMQRTSLSEFKRLAENQTKMMLSSDPAEIFTSAIRTLLDTKEFRTMPTPTDSTVYKIYRLDETIIGYFDDDYYYFIFEKAFSEVSEFCRKQGERFPLSKPALLKILRKKNYIAPVKPESNNNNCNKAFDGDKKRKFVRMFRACIDD